MINSCTKGKVGEREVRDLFRNFGFEARRGKQYAGHEDAPDVVTSLDDVLHVESKWVENLAVHKAMEQAKRDCGAKRMPVVFHRKNRTRWLVTIDAEDFMRMLQKLYLPIPDTRIDSDKESGCGDIPFEPHCSNEDAH